MANSQNGGDLLNECRTKHLPKLMEAMEQSGWDGDEILPGVTFNDVATVLVSWVTGTALTRLRGPEQVEQPRRPSKPMSNTWDCFYGYDRASASVARACLGQH